MKILSIETTSYIGSLAIIEDDRIIKEYLWRTSDVAAEIMENLDRFLYGYPTKLAEFDYLVVSTGPGSWTGIRIGISFVKGLSAGNRKKIYCVSVPESLFFTMSYSNERICCLVNAYQKKFYYAFHKGLFVLNKKIIIKSASFEEIIKDISERTIFVGPGVLEIKDKVSTEKKIQFSNSYFWYPKAGINGLLAFNKIKKGIPSPIPEPFYGR